MSLSILHIHDISLRLFLLPYIVKIDTRCVLFVYLRVLLKSVTYAKNGAYYTRCRHGSITQISEDTTQ